MCRFCGCYILYVMVICIYRDLKQAEAPKNDGSDLVKSESSHKKHSSALVPSSTEKKHKKRISSFRKLGHF